MSEKISSSQTSADELRRQFDQSFALPLANLAAESEELLALQTGGTAYAFRVREVLGLFLRTKVVPIPTDRPALLGLAGVRGVIVPVYGLGELLGHPRSPESPRWLTLCAGDLPIALGFDAFEGHLRVALEDLRSAGEKPLAEHVLQVARTPSGARAVIDIPSILKSIAARSSSP